jgi:poly-beta-1,6-N-acetyl-D-glucosamine synthase
MQYVLITAARNEERFIEQTIRAVMVQSRPPMRWVICSDGSTDQTDEIIGRNLPQCPWLSYLRLPEHRDRDFASKIECFKVGYRAVQDLPFDVIGNLDADITFENDYMAFLLDRLACMPNLGVVGTRFIENGRQIYDHRFMSANHVSGGCQLFRRACFEEIGGYLPMRGGGEDWAAVTTARMKGWVTQSFSEKLFVHHRPMGTAGNTLLRAQLRQGERDYLTGGHPLWQLFRSFYQMRRPPYVMGGTCLLLGFTWAALRRLPRPVPMELVRFHRGEQMARLGRILRHQPS